MNPKKDVRTPKYKMRVVPAQKGKSSYCRKKKHKLPQKGE